MKTREMVNTKIAIRNLFTIIQFLPEKNRVLESRDKKEILEKVENMMSAIDPGASYDKGRVAQELEANINVLVEERDSIIKSSNSFKKKPWLNKVKPEIDWTFWEQYEYFLEHVEKIPSLVVSRTDSRTDTILELLGDPKTSGKWDTRGMVAGSIQSGKTTNYIALTCKSIDVGVKVVIILGGHDEGLRTQTQNRINEGIFGEFVVEEEAGEEGSLCILAKRKSEMPVVHSLTKNEHQGDFNRILAETNIKVGGDTILLVVKKNGVILKNVLSWLKRNAKIDKNTGAHYIKDVPLLLIDDECDYYSLNTAKENEVKSINGSVRKILNMFHQSSYIGYTATPYANVFIDKKTNKENLKEFGPSLFPKDFIVNLAKSDHYYGPSEVFGLAANEEDGIEKKEALPIISFVQDADCKIPTGHKIDHKIECLPESLCEAIRVFILASCIRKERGYINDHNSMLVHLTRFKGIQCDVADLITDELRSIKNRLKEKESAIYNQFFKLFHENFIPTTNKVVQQVKDRKIKLVEWTKVKNRLYKMSQVIEVRSVNSQRRQYLNYSDYKENGLNVIAVGGDLLSRGLTIEGLSVSYILRFASAGDALVQMGRFFGYKEGYIDLCRLYTTEDLVSAHVHMARIEEELKREIDIMESRREPPEEYGLKVRMHPEGLHITAPNKRRASKEVTVSFSGTLADHTFFYKDKEIIAKNFHFLERWISSLGTPKDKEYFQWAGIEPDKILELITGYINHPFSTKTIPDVLQTYINEQVSIGNLTNWTVQIMSNTKDTVSVREGNSVIQNKVKRVKIGNLEKEVGMVIRKDGIQSNPSIYQVEKAHLITDRHESLDLKEYYPKLYSKALDDFKTYRATKKGVDPDKYNYPIGPHVRYNRPETAGFLMIYIIDPSYVLDKQCDPIVGLAISFPKTARATEVKYLANETYISKLH
ncbi:Z1 domain-containing protein [Rossellomorea sp. LjRoot5]|uniref:Z1 domain-containing protein n=1 Tax=Rossellomorea sp. LjRoot5 TaxID=3342331 RepID=UPI003ECDC8DA